MPRSPEPPLASAAERVARLAVMAAVLLVPVVFSRAARDPFGLVKMTALWVCLVVALGAWLLGALVSGRRWLPRSPVIAVALVLAAVATVSTLVSPNPALSFFGLYRRNEGLASLVLYVGLLAVIVGLYQRRPDAIREIAGAVAVAAGVAGAVVVLQQTGIESTPWQRVTGGAFAYPPGPGGNPTFTASHLGISMPFVIYMVLSSQRWLWRAAWLVPGVLAVAGIFLTQGRAGLLGGLAGAGALFLFTTGSVLGRRIGVLPKVSVVAAVLVALVLMPLFIADPHDSAREGLTRTGSAYYRTQIWEGSIRMSMARPILGWGPESFGGQYGRFRTHEDARRLGLHLTEKPHNVFLGWSTSTGLAGLGTFMVLVGMGLVMSVRTAGNDSSRQLLAAAFGAGLVAYLVQGLYSLDPPGVALMLWVSLGGIVVLARKGGSEKEDDRDVEDFRPSAKRSPRRAAIGGGVIALVVLAAVVLGTGPLRADMVLRQAILAGNERSPDALALFERAIALRPAEPAYYEALGGYLEAIAEYPAGPYSREEALLLATSQYRRALEIHTGSEVLMTSLGRVYTLLGDDDPSYFREAERWMARVLAADSLNPDAHHFYGLVLHLWSQSIEDEDLTEATRLLQRSRSHAGIAEGLREGRIVDYTFSR